MSVKAIQELISLVWGYVTVRTSHLYGLGLRLSASTVVSSPVICNNANVNPNRNEEDWTQLTRGGYNALVWVYVMHMKVLSASRVVSNPLHIGKFPSRGRGGKTYA